MTDSIPQRLTRISHQVAQVGAAAVIGRLCTRGQARELAPVAWQIGPDGRVWAKCQLPTDVPAERERQFKCWQLLIDDYPDALIAAPPTRAYSASTDTLRADWLISGILRITLTACLVLDPPDETSVEAAAESDQEPGTPIIAVLGPDGRDSGQTIIGGRQL